MTMDHENEAGEDIKMKPAMKIERRKQCFDNCSVRNCLDRSSPRHRFPNPKKHLNKFYQWVKLCGLNPSSITDPLHFRFNRNFVCHRHFTPDCFMGRKIKETAIPQLFLPDDVVDDADFSSLYLPISLPDDIQSNVTVNDEQYFNCTVTQEEMLSVSPTLPSPHSIKTYHRRCSKLGGKPSISSVSPPPYEIKTYLSKHSRKDNLLKRSKDSLNSTETDTNQVTMKSYKHCKTLCTLQNLSAPKNIVENKSDKTIDPLQNLTALGIGCSVLDCEDPMKYVETAKSALSAKQCRAQPNKESSSNTILDPIGPEEEISFEPIHPLDVVETKYSTELSSSFETSRLIKQEESLPNEIIDSSGQVFRSCHSQKELKKSKPLIKATEVQRVQVLGNIKNFRDPSFISSILKQVKLEKKGPVYILPIKGEVDGKLTNSKLEKIISQNASGSSQKKILRLLQGKEMNRRIIQDKKSKSLRKRTCKCDIHCKKTIIGTGISAKLEGALLNNDSDLFNLSDYTNKFSLSTILTNVNDKSQIEQLCQMMIECIFRLKNINAPRTLGTLTVYLTHNADNKSILPHTRPFDTLPQQMEVNCDNYSKREQAFLGDTINNWPNTEIETSDLEVLKDVKKSSTDSYEHNKYVKDLNNSAQSQNFGNHSIFKHKNVKLDLAAFHDHNYPLLGSRFIFQKPDFLVHLIDINKYKSLKKKPTVFSARRKVISPQQLQKEKNNKKLRVFKEKLRKKNNDIKILKEKNKFLKKLIQEKGIKSLKYPKSIFTNKNSKKATINVEKKNDPWENFGEVNTKCNHIDNNSKEQKKSKHKKIKNYSPMKKKTEIPEGSHAAIETNVCFHTSENKKKSGIRNRIIKNFAPDFDLGVLLDPQTPEYIVNTEPHLNSNFLSSYKALFDALIEEEL